MSDENKKKLIKRSFLSRNLVTVVMIPALIAIHWGWDLLQRNETFVKKEEKIELPIVTGAKHFWRRIQEEMEGRTK